MEIVAGPGVVSACAAKIVDPGNVFSFEASPRNAEMARATSEMNGMDTNLRTAAVVGDSVASTIRVYDSGPFWSSGLLERDLDDRSASVTTAQTVRLWDVLDDLVPGFC